MSRHFKIAFILLIMVTGCISEQMHTLDAVEQRVSAVAEKLSSGKLKTAELDSINAESSGYYYIIDSRANLVYHPKKALIGSSFSRLGFVRKILEEKNGCIRSDAGGISRIIIFRKKSGDEILCYTVAESGVSAAERCNIYKEEEAK